MRLLSHSIRRWACALGVSLLSFGGAHATEDAPPIDLHLTYDFYLAGVPVAVAKFQANIEEDSYNAVSAVKTVGVVGFFFDTEVVSSADGQRVDGEALIPALFEMRSRQQEKRQDVRMAFKGDAPEDVEAQPPFRPKDYEIEPSAQAGALDPISAVVAAFLPQDVETLCNRTLPIFDSRRRYDVRFLDKVADYDRDGQRTIECAAEYRRIAGFKPKMMKHPAYPFKIRFVVDEDGSAQAVRIWGETHFGVAVALLRK